MLNPSGREYGLMRLVAPHFFASSWVLRFPNFHGIYDQEVKIKLICCFLQFCTSLLAQIFLAELQDVSRCKICYKYIPQTEDNTYDPSQEPFYQQNNQNSWMQPLSQPLEIYSKDKVSTLMWGKKPSKMLLKSDMFLVLKDQDLQQ